MQVAIFFYANGLSFNVARSNYWRRMVAAVAAAGPGYLPPSYDALRTTKLDEVGAWIRRMHEIVCACMNLFYAPWAGSKIRRAICFVGEDTP